MTTPKAFLLEEPQLADATDLLYDQIFEPSCNHNELEIIPILLEEATLLLNWVLQVPEKEPFDFSYFDDAVPPWTDIFAPVGDAIVNRADWIKLTLTYDIDHVVVVDCHGRFSVHIVPGETGECI